jgi:predicted lipoprotein with Yx(FWY)xxD motif
MKRLLILGAGLAAALTLVACGGGGGNSSPTVSMASGSAGTVSVKAIGGAGNVLVDSSGQALYASDQESAAHKVLCTGACNSFWEPLTVSGGAPKAGSVPGKLGVTKRPDGTKQVTYNGKLLYSFTQDQPGEVTGDGFNDAFSGQQFTWHVVGIGNGGGSSSAASSGSSQSPY